MTNNIKLDSTKLNYTSFIHSFIYQEACHVSAIVVI